MSPRYEYAVQERQIGTRKWELADNGGTRTLAEARADAAYWNDQEARMSGDPQWEFRVVRREVGRWEVVK